MKNPQAVTVEDFFGLGYHEGLKYSLTAMRLFTGLVNNKGYPIVLAMKILKLADIVDMAYKLALSLAFCKGVASITAVTFISTFEGILYDNSLIALPITSLVTKKLEGLKTGSTCSEDKKNV